VNPLTGLFLEMVIPLVLAGLAREVEFAVSTDIMPVSSFDCVELIGQIVMPCRRSRDYSIRRSRFSCSSRDKIRDGG
jgi:hypothetical protein